MRTASAIPYISLFWIQQTHTADCKKSVVGQLNVQTATAGKEK